MIATWVKKHRRAERFTICFGIFLMRFPASRTIMLPQVWVYSNGTAVSSRFSSNGTFPAVLAFWHNHWHHFHVNVAWSGRGGGGSLSWEASNCLRPPFRSDLGPEHHVRLCWQSGRYPVEASWKAKGSSGETTGTRRIAYASVLRGGKQEAAKIALLPMPERKPYWGGGTEGQPTHLNPQK